MEEKIINMNQFLGAAQGDQEHMLGKFLYFSLANLLVDKDELSSLCESMGIPYTGSTRLSLGDAFRSATGDIRERVPVTVDGETNIYLAYCRDNKRTAGVFSRELVKETLNRETTGTKSWRISAAVRTTECSAVIISCWTMRWMCRAAAEKRRSFLNSTSDAPTASRSRPSASIFCEEWRPPS